MEEKPENATTPKTFVSDSGHTPKKRAFIFSNTLLNFLLHFFVAILWVVGLILLIFMVYLPFTTKHGETVTVPLLHEMAQEEAVLLLEKKNLRAEIIDSMYKASLPPGVVITQTPKMNEKVKLNRKVYLTVSAFIPPEIDIPDVIDNSVKSAQLLLKSHELLVGDTKYVDDLATNAVLKVVYNGKEYNKSLLRSGVSVPKGTKIDLIVGNGLGKTSMSVPGVLRMDIREAKTLLRGVGLSIGNVNWVKSEETPFTVVKQVPGRGVEIKTGQIIDLWVAEPPEEEMPEE